MEQRKEDTYIYGHTHVHSHPIYNKGTNAVVSGKDSHLSKWNQTNWILIHMKKITSFPNLHHTLKLIPKDRAYRK